MPPAMEGIVIRPARSEDRVAVERLIEDAGLPTAGVRESFDHFVVAESGAELVGVAGLERHGADGVLRSVAVAMVLELGSESADLVRRPSVDTAHVSTEHRP